MAGFFSTSTLIKAPPVSLTPKCGACGLFKQCQSPKFPVYGKGKKKLLILSAFPGKQEDENGRLLIGNTGRFLTEALESNDVDIKRDCWLYHALICHPNGAVDNNKIESCRPNIIKTIRELQPNAVLLLGTEACQSLFGWLWDSSDIGDLGRWLGRAIPHQKQNMWICPTYNPAYILREEKDGRRHNPLPRKRFYEHIKTAVELATDKPWDTVPDWMSEVEIIQNPQQATKAIKHANKAGNIISFDYEGNMLKPEGKSAFLVSCSICVNNKRTFAYPLTGDAVDATRDILKNGDVGKIAHNMKFEDRWSREYLKTPVNGWKLCTMTGAHHLDSRPETKSLKFQSFIHFGFAAYNHHIEPLLKSDGSMLPNKIREISWNDLLLYNGIDSLVEFKLAILQSLQIGDELNEISACIDEGTFRTAARRFDFDCFTKDSR